MIIDKSKTIASIKEQFNEKYPGLKIEFFDQPHDVSKGSPAEHQYPDDLTLNDISRDGAGGDISLDPNMTVAAVEQTFEDKFGLHVQIYRRSNKLWLQTSATDEWTLEVQNRKGLHSVQ